MRNRPAPNDFRGWVSQLGVNSRRQEARQHLMTSGPAAVPAVREGLQHRKPIVRRMCARILDHLVDEESIPALVAALDDDDPTVTARALHALACDACKEGECRPSDNLFVPRALELLNHPDPGLRVAAIDALAKVAQRGRDDIVDVLDEVAERDPISGLRHMARRGAQRARKLRRAVTAGGSEVRNPHLAASRSARTRQS